MKWKMLIIIPAYNEEENIVSVITDLKNHLSDLSISFDILVIDDGSTDRTREIARSVGVEVLSLPYNQGIGTAVQTGYIYAERKGYEVAVQFDGDGQHRADQIALILEPILRGEADLVVGSRFLQQGTYRAPWTRLLGIKILSLIISTVTGTRITDPTSGFRAASRKVIEFFSRWYPDDYPEPESLVFLHRAGFRLKEVPVLMRERQAGSSSITFLRGVYYMIKVTLAVFIDLMKRIP